MKFPEFGAQTTFDEACTLVLAYLQAEIPMGFWSVTRHSEDRQLYLAVDDSVYRQRAGNSHPWSDSMCRHMLIGTGPQIAPDVEQVPAYASAGIRASHQIGAYIGLPLLQADGEIFGTICGLDQSAQPAALVQHGPMLQILAQLLSTILQADLMRTELQQLAERSGTDAETDVLTGLYNRRGWNRFLAAEEARYRRFGHTGSVIILDLDSLKSVNDRYGHEAGDAHLRQAARAIQETTREADIAARLGGDEFGILAAQANSEQAQILVNRLAEQLTLVGTPGSIGHAPYSIISGFPGAWRNADAAMYEQKRLRRSDASPAATRAAVPTD